MHMITTTNTTTSPMTMMVKKIVALQLFLFLQQQFVTVHGLAVGDEVCVEGYIMDQYCIDLGYLLDNPSVVTLENPGAHSLHCLLDVGVCRASNYVVLLEPGTTNAPINSPVTTLTPTTSPTTNNPTVAAPTTKEPTVTTNIPTKVPTTKSSFNDLFALLPRYTRSPQAAPTTTTITPTSDNNNDDFFSLLKPTNTNNVTEPSSSSSANLEVRAVNSSLYSAGYIVDDVGKDLLIQLGREVGICSTCGTTGNLRSGLRAELRGTITEVSTIIGGGPHRLAVSSVQLSTNTTSICQSSSETNATKIYTKLSPTQSPSLRSTNRNG